MTTCGSRSPHSCVIERLIDFLKLDVQSGELEVLPVPLTSSATFAVDGEVDFTAPCIG